MPDISKQWKVLPHGSLAEIDDGLLTVTGELSMPLVDVQRRMTVVRLNDGRLVVFSAISLHEDEMRALDDYGRPAFLIVPNAHHRIDAPAWKQRYPAIVVVAPAAARAKVEEAVPVDTVAPDFGDADVEFVAVPGTQGHEAALVVRRRAGTTLVLNDLVGNIRGESGFGGWLLRMMGLAGDEPHIPVTTRLGLVKDKDALRAQLLAWAEIGSLRRILVSHGVPIEDEPAEVLRGLAATLG